MRSLLFAPGNDERKLRKALESRADAVGAGVFALDGAMVDLPVVTRARRILSEAERRTA